jgi:hypothetical protein
MFKASSLVRTAVAAAALFAAGVAFAEGTFVPELGFAQTSGKNVVVGTQRTRDPAVVAAFGYEMDNGFGARAMVIGDWDIQTQILPGYRTFENFVGVEATGKYALANTLNLRGGIGIGRSRLGGNGHELDGEGVLSLGLQWRPFSHFAMEVHVDRLTKTGTNAVGLLMQVPF